MHKPSKADVLKVAGECGLRFASNAVLCLDAETVQCYLYALLAEAKRRGGKAWLVAALNRKRK